MHPRADFDECGRKSGAVPQLSLCAFMAGYWMNFTLPFTEICLAILAANDIKYDL